MRTAAIKRTTKETDIQLELCLDGGPVDIKTGIGFFDHMLTAFCFYAGFGAKLSVEGDLYVDGHHSVEDTGIVLGQAIKQAAGERTGIRRFASAYIPMDEALCRTVLDFSGRPFLVYDAPAFPAAESCGYDFALTEEFMRALAVHAGITLHQKVCYGKNAHHITEALFKSLGLAMKEALHVESGAVVSTKGVLD